MFTVREASVVLVSPSPIDGQSMRPEVLRETGIISPDWAIVNNISTPVVAQLQYQNGFTIQVEGNRCSFKEPIHGEPRETYEVHPLVSRYLKETKLVLYNALGINWLLNMAPQNPTTWMLDHIAFDPKLNGFSPVLLQLAQNFTPAICNFIFKADNRQVTVDCNYHFQLSGDAPQEASKLLDTWHRYQTHMSGLMSQL